MRAASAHLCLNYPKLIAEGYAVEIFDRSRRGFSTVGRGLGVKMSDLADALLALGAVGP